MKILHCIPTLEVGGAQRQISYLAPEQVKIGYDVHVGYLKGGSNFDRLERGGVILHRIESKGNHDPRIFLQLLRLILRLKPDIVQTWLLQMDVIGGFAAGVVCKSWVLTERNSSTRYTGTVKFRLRRWLGRRASALVSNSFGGDAYWEKVIGTSRRYVVPNGLPIDEIREVDSGTLPDQRCFHEQKLVLYAGRFEKGKNMGNLIDALSIVIRESAIRALLCGDGPYMPELAAKVKNNGLASHIILPGFVTNLWAWMKRADVFVFVSDFEGFPNVLGEAMLCGCPLIVSDIPAHREILNEQNALFVNPRDPSEIASAIRKTLLIPDEAKMRAESAKIAASRWTIPAMAIQYDRVYREVLEREKSKR